MLKLHTLVTLIVIKASLNKQFLCQNINRFKVRKSIMRSISKISSSSSKTLLTNYSLRPVGSGKKLDDFKKDLTIDDHMITLFQLTSRYNTDLHEGLDEEFAASVLKTNGPNCLIPPKPKSRWLILAEYIFAGFSVLLWIGALLSFTGCAVTYYNTHEVEKEQLYLGGLLITVIVVTGLFGFYQESVNTSVMDSFKKMLPKCAYIIREGVYYEIPSEELVVGDLIQVKAGSCIPADVRIINSNGLKVDNSSITGESEPQNRYPVCTDANPLETVNLAFYGTNVVEGTGYGIVIATGTDTLMGHIAGLTTTLKAEDTNIKKELKFFIRLISVMATCVGSACFTMSLIMGHDVFESFIFCIAIIVANVPEGLLVTMTACLTLTAKRMAGKKCLVKNLQAIETLGSTSVICSDKTGTLTQNKMTVSHLYYDRHTVDVLSPAFTINPTGAFKMLCRVGVLCSKAEYHSSEMDLSPEKRTIIGDASESAVFKCMETLVGDVMNRRDLNPKICEIPFNSTNKYQVSIHKRSSGQYLLVMKGAPERILDRCTTMCVKNRNVSIEKYRHHILKAVLEIGYMGERVLAFADLELPSQKYPSNFQFDTNDVNFPLEGLRFVGLMSLIDPPKDGVLEAVEKCRTAGIRVVMLTGDHPITAMSIAKKVGIISPDKITKYDIAIKNNVSVGDVRKEDVPDSSAIVVAGSELRLMSNDELDNIIENYKEIVFARTSPQQKLQIVESFQRKGEIVGVTGDGVNDSPALKKADIGISMGITGSDVSKDAADMIILDDNFTSIVIGIEEGRLIFDNLKKSIAYLLTSNVPEILPFLLFILVNIPSALSVMAIITIDIGTDLWPAISLAYEKAEADIMSRMPRDPSKEKLVNLKLLLFTFLQIGVIQACAGFTAYFFTMACHGFLIERVFNLREEWESDRNDILDSYGQEWSKKDRQLLSRKGFSAYFLAIVVTQVADALICKTRKLSIIHQGMRNWVFNVGILFECLLAGLVVYCPYVNDALQFAPVEVICFLPALPYAILIVLYDEVRRYILRTHPGGWVDRETYY